MKRHFKSGGFGKKKFKNHNKNKYTYSKSNNILLFVIINIIEL